jgi:hypothetical protein
VTLKLDDLPQELRDAIYINDCHVTGMHEPDHTTKYVCDIQLRELAERVLAAIGIDIRDKLQGETGAQATARRRKAVNLIPRKLQREHFSWYNYHVEHSDDPHNKTTAEALAAWEKNGFVFPSTKRKKE